MTTRYFYIILQRLDIDQIYFGYIKFFFYKINF